VQQEGCTDQNDNDKFFGQLCFKILDCTLDNTRAVVGCDKFNAFRQVCLQLFDTRLNRLDCGQGVPASTQDDHTANGISFAVKLPNSTAHFRAKADICHVP